MRTKLLLPICFGLLASIAHSQNQLNLGQYMIHQPFINPAANGSYQNLTFAGFYKAQWVKFNGAPVIQGFNAIIPFGNKKQSIGLTATHDAIGINNNAEISVTYAYRAKVAVNSYLVFGLGGSLDLIQSDYNKLHTITPDDPLFQSSSPLVPLPDFKFGLYFFRNKFYAGFALPNLMNNRVTFTTGGASVGSTQFDMDYLHYHFHTGYSFKLNSKWDLNASTLFKQVSGAPLQADLNGQFMYNKKIGFGASYRTSNELIGILTLGLSPEFKFSYAYEYNMGDIGNYSTGTHELMLIYQLAPPKESVIAVPRF